MSGGSSNNTSTTNTTATPWSGVQPFLKQGYETANELFETGGPQYFPGQTYVDPNPYELQGQNMALQAAMGPLGQSASALNTGLQQSLMAPNVANNQYVGGMADVIQKRLGRQFTEQLNPAIRSNAVASGGLGGSRQGIAQGIAARGISEATGDALAQLYGDAYGQGLEAQGRALVAGPSAMQASLFPSQTVGQVGAFHRGTDELALQDQMNRFNYEQNAPYQNLSNYMNILQGAPWGTSSTSSVPSQSNPVSGAIGGGMLGYGLGSSVAALNPYTAPLAIGGALLGGLFS